MTAHRFQRARSEEQRAIRRQAILAEAAAMLAEMPVADLSLNELSRRVGLAKSNVLRYFSSREAVLLDLLDTAWRGWLDRVAADLARKVDPTAASSTRTTQLAQALTDSLVDDRLFCELISVSAAVLERNISPEVARRYKLAAITNTATLATTIRAAVPELSEVGATNLAGGTLISITGLWPLANPSAAMLCVYDDPAMAALRIDLATALREMLTTLLVGGLVRWPA